MSGVYGVAMDVPVSQCPWAGCTLTEGQAIVEFGDGTLAFKTLPYRPIPSEYPENRTRRSFSA
jgi:hypothetical protein